MHQLPILIVGAGPTGLFSAYLLLKQGIPVKIIDRKEGPSTHSKALAIHPRTLEILDKAGIVDVFIQKGLFLEGMRFHSGQRDFTISLQSLDSPFPFILSLPQIETEKILLSEIEKLGGVVEWNCEFVGEENKQALIYDIPSQQTYKLPYHTLLGCDGARSRVRSFHNFSFLGKDLHEEVLLLDVKGTSPLDLNYLHMLNTKNGPVILIAMEEHCFRLIIPHFSDFHFSKHPPLTEDVNTFLKNRAIQNKFIVEEVIWSSIFSIRQRMVQKLRKGHVFLIGDAAHVHSPVGGQGMNTCLQDTFNLCWKLGLTYHNLAYDSLLDTYESERLPVIQSLLKATTEASKTLIKRKLFARFLFLPLLKVLSRTSLKKILIDSLSQISVCYKKSAYIRAQSRDQKWEGPKAGQRAPDEFIADGRRLFDLLRTQKHTLLVFDPDSIFLNDEFIREYKEILDVRLVTGEKVRKKYAAESETVYLVRPDGMIGYRSRQMRVEEVISYIFRIFKPASLKNKE
jgi:2-polyprenyl-6-methoxyphenol hydroxylase-like FAD-dependent oxidoreductase